MKIVGEVKDNDDNALLSSTIFASSPSAAAAPAVGVVMWSVVVLPLPLAVLEVEGPRANAESSWSANEVVVALTSQEYVREERKRD